jgi:hypothetical protein
MMSETPLLWTCSRGDGYSTGTTSRAESFVQVGLDGSGIVSVRHTLARDAQRARVGVDVLTAELGDLMDTQPSEYREQDHDARPQ